MSDSKAAGSTGLTDTAEHGLKERVPFCDSSSVFLLCLLELICSLGRSSADIAQMAYRRLVLGQDNFGRQFEGKGPLDLMMWWPPLDWGQHVLRKPLGNAGECVTVDLGSVGHNDELTGEEIHDSLTKLVEECRQNANSYFQRIFHYR